MGEKNIKTMHKTQHSLKLFDHLHHDIDALTQLSPEHAAQTIVVCVQHILESNVLFFDALTHKLDIPKDNIFILGKHYSTSPHANKTLVQKGFRITPNHTLNRQLGHYHHCFQRDVNTLWQEVLNYIQPHKHRNILVIDDGGRCFEHMPKELFKKFKVLGIEQTTIGIRKCQQLKLPCPIISVASCHTKRVYESEFIIEDVLFHARQSIRSKKQKIGIIGLGNLGSTLYRNLCTDGYSVHAFDVDPEKMAMVRPTYRMYSLSALLQHVDMIFSCTGTDIFQHQHDVAFHRDTTLISCTSEDVEFNSLLCNKSSSITTRFPDTDALSDLQFEDAAGHCITIKRGGFPINFNGQSESIPLEKIQLTRALMLSAAIQANEYYSQKMFTPGIYDLDYKRQLALIQCYKSLQADSTNEKPHKTKPAALIPHPLAQLTA